MHEKIKGQRGRVGNLAGLVEFHQNTFLGMPSETLGNQFPLTTSTTVELSSDDNNTVLYNRASYNKYITLICSWHCWSSMRRFCKKQPQLPRIESSQGQPNTRLLSWRVYCKLYDDSQKTSFCCTLYSLSCMADWLRINN